MKDIKTIENKVLKILTECKEARSDDYFLWLLLCNESKDRVLLDATFGAVLQGIYATELPLFDTVSRARRKVQAAHPELKVPTTARRRRAKEEAYREYARS